MQNSGTCKIADTNPQYTSGKNRPAVQKPVIRTERTADIYAFGIILSYCILWAFMRISISPSMEADTAEQYLEAAGFLTHKNQPPLYTWIILGVSSFLGLNPSTIIIVKYLISFLFFFSFYVLVRGFWNAKESLIITGSLLLIPTYSYSFNRDLTHLILVTAMAVISTIFYFRLIKGQKGLDYFLLGVTAGLGVLSKYNYAIFLAALAITSLLVEESRRAVFNKKILASMAGCLIALLPFLWWLSDGGLHSFSYAMNRADIGQMSVSPLKALVMLPAIYVNAFIFPVIFIFIFRGHLSGSGAPELKAIRVLGIISLLTPLLFIIPSGNFIERWLSPVLFLLPPALFSMLRSGVPARKFKILISICITVAIGVFTARTLVGFMPDVAGKVERIHMPFKALAFDLTDELKRNEIKDTTDLILISDSEHVGANIVAWMPGTRFVHLQDISLDSLPTDRTAVYVWNASDGKGMHEGLLNKFPSLKFLPPLTADYIYSKKFPAYKLGAVFLWPCQRDH
jgi:4-amino-4-deoxy-L-arabinose transferase-like glycosyltransferase